MSDNDSLWLTMFTMVVYRKIVNPHLCLSLLEEINKHYKLSKIHWSGADGLIDICNKMDVYIEKNLTHFMKSPLTKAF